MVRCTLPNEVIDPEVFRDLRSWAEYGGFTWLRTWNLPSGWQLAYRSLVIVLSTSPSEHNANEPIRVDASELVFNTLVLDEDAEVRFEHHEAALTQAVTTVSLNCLRFRILHFLETIWMDERCRMTGAVFQNGTGAHEFIENSDPDWTPPDTSDEKEYSWDLPGFSRWLRKRDRANDSQLNPAELVARDEGVRDARRSLEDAQHFLRMIMNGTWKS